MYRQSEKLLNSNISSTCPHSMTNFGVLTAEIDWRVLGTPANFNGFHVLSSLLHRHHSTDPNFVRCLAVSLAGTLYIQFWRLLSLTEFCQVQNSLCAQVLRFPILAELLHGTRAVDASQILGRGTKMELRNFRSWLFSTESATCIQRVAITLGIGPHSS